MRISATANDFVLLQEQLGGGPTFWALWVLTTESCWFLLFSHCSHLLTALMPENSATLNVVNHNCSNYEVTVTFQFAVALFLGLNQLHKCGLMTSQGAVQGTSWWFADLMFFLLPTLTYYNKICNWNLHHCYNVVATFEWHTVLYSQHSPLEITHIMHSTTFKGSPVFVFDTACFLPNSGDLYIVHVI